MQVVVVSAGANRDAVISAMTRWSIEPLCCAGVQEARKALPRGGSSLIFCEEQLSDGSYRDLLHEFARERHMQLVLISSASDLDQAHREASELGAFETIASPCTPADIQWVAIRAMHDAERRVRIGRSHESGLPAPPNSAVQGH